MDNVNYHTVNSIGKMCECIFPMDIKRGKKKAHILLSALIIICTPRKITKRLIFICFDLPFFHCLKYSGKLATECAIYKLV